MSNGNFNTGLRQLMDEGNLMDFAFALSRQDQNRESNSEEPSQPAIEPAPVIPEPPTPEEKPTLDVIFSEERQRQFQMAIIKTLCSKKTFSVESIGMVQIIVSAISSLDPDDIDEVQMIDLARVGNVFLPLSVK
jgi:hypothetical protein